MLDDLVADAKERMGKALTSTRDHLATVRTGRASAAMLDRITIDYYGARTPLRQVAQISVPEARLLVVAPYDRESMRQIERAIQESDLGVTPSNDGKVIRLPVPPLTEERRREFVKVARHLGEEGKVAVRNIRRDVLKDVHELDHEGEVSAEDARRAEDQVQKLTDQHVHQIDEAVKTKEAEILEV